VGRKTEYRFYGPIYVNWGKMHTNPSYRSGSGPWGQEKEHTWGTLGGWSKWLSFLITLLVSQTYTCQTYQIRPFNHLHVNYIRVKLLRKEEGH
jgi:hypothetical protein